jgi:hypothetical protein
MNTPLTWHSVGLGEWSAWSYPDGRFAPAECRIHKTHRGYKAEIRSIETCEDVVVVHLNHSDFTLEDAQRWVERELAETLPLVQPSTVDTAVVKARMDALAEARPLNCRFVHAFPPDAKDSDVCQCGRVTKGCLKQKAS